MSPKDFGPLFCKGVEPFCLCLFSEASDRCEIKLYWYELPFFFCLSFFLGKEWTLFFFFRGGDFEELLIVHDNQSVRLLRRRLLSEISFPVRAKMPPERKK